MSMSSLQIAPSQPLPVAARSRSSKERGPSSFESLQQGLTGSPLPSPRALAAEVALGRAGAEQIALQRDQIRRIVHGADGRLLVIVGPCSVHRPDEAMDYAERLVSLARRLSPHLLIAMRVYVEKPRSSVGWKGLLNDPNLDGTCDLVKGLRVSRGLMRDIAELGLPIATELLDTNLSAYLVDLLSWAAIGARTSTSQPHRELVSGLQLPVGFKNSPDGSLDGALGAMQSAGQSHCRVGVASDGQLQLERTHGNPDVHLTLRGGSSGPNYDERSVREATEQAKARGLNHRLVVDCSHGNSNKDHRNQPKVLQEVARQVALGSHDIAGVMLESQLQEGRQELSREVQALTYGQSVTDACIDWPTTARLLEQLADVVRSRSPRTR